MTRAQQVREHLRLARQAFEEERLRPWHHEVRAEADYYRSKVDGWAREIRS